MFALLLTRCAGVFAAADRRRHPHPAGLLHEEAPLVCAEEQENRLQASQIKRTDPLPPQLGSGARARSSPRCRHSQYKLLQLTRLSGGFLMAAGVWVWWCTLTLWSWPAAAHSAPRTFDGFIIFLCEILSCLGVSLHPL